MSILRTFAARRDTRPLLLIYGNGVWEDVLFRDELDVLPTALKLTVVHVIERPPADWTGESGRITPALLARWLPAEQADARAYAICGPPTRMDSVARELRRRRVPLHRVHAERFDIAERRENTSCSISMSNGPRVGSACCSSRSSSPWPCGVQRSRARSQAARPSTRGAAPGATGRGARARRGPAHCCASPAKRPSYPCGRPSTRISSLPRARPTVRNPGRGCGAGRPRRRR